MIMNPSVLNKDHMTFFDKAMKGQRSQMLSAMADAVSECRTASDTAAQLSETGEVALLRLVEIWCGINATPSGIVLEGTEVQILADVLAQIYAYLTLHSLQSPVGMAIYVELNYMMCELMQGEWFE
ncbi:MAG: DUF3851 family protein [Eubacteriales bacterium]|nr:DUF3851 family protein [Eubacteriales bacterium]